MCRHGIGQDTLITQFARATTQQGRRDGQALGVRASQALLDSCSTRVGGVLTGRSDVPQGGASAAPLARAHKG
jgi:hypothetical protein